MARSSASPTATDSPALAVAGRGQVRLRQVHLLQRAVSDRQGPRADGHGHGAWRSCSATATDQRPATWPVSSTAAERPRAPRAASAAASSRAKHGDRCRPLSAACAARRVRNMSHAASPSGPGRSSAPGGRRIWLASPWRWPPATSPTRPAAPPAPAPVPGAGRDGEAGSRRTRCSATPPWYGRGSRPRSASASAARSWSGWSRSAPRVEAGTPLAQLDTAPISTSASGRPRRSCGRPRPWRRTPGTSSRATPGCTTRAGRPRQEYRARAGRQSRPPRRRSGSSRRSWRSPATTSATPSCVADAPGLVTAVLVEPGQVVPQGQTVFKIARLGEIEVVANIPESQVGLLDGRTCRRSCGRCRASRSRAGCASCRRSPTRRRAPTGRASRSSIRRRAPSSA